MGRTQRFRTGPFSQGSRKSESSPRNTEFSSIGQCGMLFCMHKIMGLSQDISCYAILYFNSMIIPQLLQNTNLGTHLDNPIGNRSMIVPCLITGRYLNSSQLSSLPTLLGRTFFEHLNAAKNRTFFHKSNFDSLFQSEKDAF